MTSDQIKELQKRIGATPDGFWGPRSIAACQAHLRNLMPNPNPWPATDQNSLTAFYGPAGDESRLVALNVEDLNIRYEGQKVGSIRCHTKCASSLLRVLREVQVCAPDVLKFYAGCYNYRAMRGGSTPSLHARGAAIDLDPDPNGNLVHWPAAAFMPLSVMEAFAREGWLSAGACWGRDAMHFYATA